MGDTKESLSKQDFKAVPVTPTPVAVTADTILQLPDGKVLKGKELIELAASGFDFGRPPDDGPCGNFWCTRMNSPIPDWREKARFEDIAVLIRAGLIQERDLVAFALGKIGVDLGRPGDDDPCARFVCAAMKPVAGDWLAKVNPAVLAVFVQLGIIQESALSKAQQAELAAIRKQ